MVSSLTLLSSAIALLAALSAVDATDRGLAWATDNNFAPVIGSKPKITWYHRKHPWGFCKFYSRCNNIADWEFGAVSQMPAKNEFVPMFWGTSVGHPLFCIRT
jgi:hypothetical protein